jgi:hypothetical protein
MPCHPITVTPKGLNSTSLPDVPCSCSHAKAHRQTWTSLYTIAAFMQRLQDRTGVLKGFNSARGTLSTRVCRIFLTPLMATSLEGTFLADSAEQTLSAGTSKETRHSQASPQAQLLWCPALPQHRCRKSPESSTATAALIHASTAAVSCQLSVWLLVGKISTAAAGCWPTSAQLL